MSKQGLAAAGSFWGSSDRVYGGEAVKCLRNIHSYHK